MAAPTRQQLNILSDCASIADQGYQTLTALHTLGLALTNSPSVAGIATADFTAVDTNGSPLAGTFGGFPPSVFADFSAAIAAAATAVQATSAAIMKAFQAMREYKS